MWEVAVGAGGCCSCLGSVRQGGCEECSGIFISEDVWLAPVMRCCNTSVWGGVLSC